MLDHRGATKAGWPIQMGEIQGQPAAADINGDGETEIIAADTKGNVAVFTHRGLEVWERHLASLVAQVRLSFLSNNLPARPTSKRHQESVSSQHNRLPQPGYQNSCLVVPSICQTQQGSRLPLVCFVHPPQAKSR